MIAFIDQPLRVMIAKGGKLETPISWDRAPRKREIAYKRDSQRSRDR